MEKKRMMEHGAVQEEISLRIEYDIHKCEDSLRTEGKITKEVSLGWNNILCGRGMSIGDILDFQEKANALLQKVKALLADGTYVKVSVTKAAYENVPPFEVIDQFGPHMCALNQFQPPMDHSQPNPLFPPQKRSRQKPQGSPMVLSASKKRFPKGKSLYFPCEMHII